MTRADTRQHERLARRGRIVALVIAGTMLVWLAAQWIGQSVGLPGRYAFLFDFAAIAALIWALVNIYQIWRARRTLQG
ncbi:hypothetical protein SAMN04490248_10379 [Salinihabitans flavidus]|uniref:Uncharacterized protein n=1 Tax=Salinihabitans flavidus TaxID=569882 RepID=A0A1H8N9Y1_9RHOB|nr:DUF5337 domain-containing protein [Salinihabitans flavidus]SEO26511.1 hypothetical protein SAMN04490248_10379 [Salinihabitans flavidus]